MRSIAPLLVVGAIVSLSACANEKGGTTALGTQDKIGSAQAGDCIVGDLAGTKYCGPYAKQWCRDNPYSTPYQGSCAGVPGWRPFSDSGGASAGGSPGGSSGSSQSGATPSGGSNSGSSRIICDPVDPHYPCYDQTTGALRTGGSNSGSSGSGSPGSSSAGGGSSGGGSPNGSSGSQNSGSQNSGSQNSGSNSGTNYGPGNGYVP
jgi:hypothetical protein